MQGRSNRPLYSRTCFSKSQHLASYIILSRSLVLGENAPLRDVDSVEELADVESSDEARLADESTRL